MGKMVTHILVMTISTFVRVQPMGKRHEHFDLFNYRSPFSNPNHICQHINVPCVLSLTNHCSSYFIYSTFTNCPSTQKLTVHATEKAKGAQYIFSRI